MARREGPPGHALSTHAGHRLIPLSQPLDLETRELSLTGCFRCLRSPAEMGQGQDLTLGPGA